MIAFLKEVALGRDRSETAHATGARVNVKLALKQHAQFAATLKELGARVEFVPALPEPSSDGVFIENTAVLLPEVAVIARPGTTPRDGELELVTRILAQHRPLQSIVEPGALDGSDVLRIGHTIFAAESGQTSVDGITQLREIALSVGYEVRPVAIRDCSHLKAACSFIPPHFFVVNPAWVDTAPFRNLSVIPVDDAEPHGANTLTVERTTLVSASCPKTERWLREAGIATRRIDISVFEKAGGGLSGLCLILEPRASTAVRNESELRTVSVAAAPAAAGHASQAIVHGGFVFVSPQLPTDSASGRAGRSSVEEQMEQAINHLALVLSSAGSSLARVVRTTIHVADPKLLARIEVSYRKTFGAHRPTRAVIVNTALPPGVLVAIEAVAAAATDLVS